ncbi:AAA-like domain-containing protein [Microcoleus sp. CAWBG58]|uniref:AAA-like domain-containing protein n=1 Tax=Microcoleus sp. CAWBG58 TaxID=2841651 RepID=UPI0025D87C68|nr:AAA-like domain-containing protein [Microcoleus sp. CAWBG58]
MMEQDEFEAKWEKLTPKQLKVLKLFLQGNTEAQIAKSIEVNNRSSVRHHISNICELFGFQNESGEHLRQRDELIPLFAEYKPQLVSDKLKETCGILSGNRQKVEFYYIERDCERKCYDKILENGALIRIKAPQKMGKTLLVDKILDRASQAGYKTALLSFEEADSEVLGDYRKLLQWLCVTLGDLLELENKLAAHWDDTLGGINPNVTKYLERYLFKDFSQPLVLVLEKVDLVFEQATFNVDFCRLLRAWHDAAKRNDRRGAIWQKIRLIVVHATEVYSSLDINSSPLAGVGFTPPLPDFTVDEVKQLARQYRHNWLSEAEIKQLMVMFGGYPYLVQTAFAYLQTPECCLTKLLEISPTAQSPFINHLRELLGKLEECPELTEVYRELVNKNQPMILKTHQTFKLESMGLLRVKNNDCFPRCDLYRQYFSQCL